MVDGCLRSYDDASADYWLTEISGLALGLPSDMLRYPTMTPMHVRGLAPGPEEDARYVVAVNDVRLPLRETGVVGEKVCGVRFRAWQPPHCLQPTIPVHHPLRFDLVDTWGRRALGACTYHVWHPEGRAYDEPPLTTFEAKARRAQRFTTDGHAAHPVVPRAPTLRPEHPYTLDLRWQ